jgi:hypothetical protein
MCLVQILVGLAALAERFFIVSPVCKVNVGIINRLQSRSYIHAVLFMIVFPCHPVSYNVCFTEIVESQTISVFKLNGNLILIFKGSGPCINVKFMF